MKKLFHGARQRVKKFRKKFDRLSKRRQIFLVVWIATSALVLLTMSTTLYFAATLSSKERIMNRNNTGVTLLDRNGKVFYQFYNARTDTHVPLAQIAPNIQTAIVAAEDQTFYKHSGFSIKGLFGAVWENIRPGGLDSGGSTITQQLVKNALLTDERSYLRKYQELILSIEIERRYTKAEILEMYLNSVHFGEGAFGVEDAAKTYYGKSAKDLTLAEASMLAGLLPAPSAYSPISGDETLAKKRQNYVLGRMVEDGYATKEQADAAKNTKLSYKPQTIESYKAPHFALMVKEELEKKYGVEKIARSGYKVKTTINLDWQSKAENAVATQVGRLSYAKVGNGSAVGIDPHTGEVVFLVGSRDWNNKEFGKVNLVSTPRQPGSSFKPIVYATGIEEKNISAATILHDKLTDFGGGYKPQNFNLSFKGDVTARRALANSLNIPAVEALQKIGISDTIDMAKSLGITTLTEEPSTYGLSLALGTGQVRLLELANVYATFADQGDRHDIQLIKEITDKSNKRIFESKPTTTKALSAETAYIMSSMLSDNNARAETFGSALTLSGGRTAAVKTGTNEDYRDALTVGYTPSLAVGVWVGNNDYTPMTSVGGSLGAAPIWRQLMQETLAGTPNEQFAKPSSILERQVCRGTGALAANSGSNTYSEFFRNGTLPTAQCNTAAPAQPTTPKPTTPKPTAPTTPAPTPEDEEEPEDEPEEETPPPDDDDTDEDETPTAPTIPPIINP